MNIIRIQKGELFTLADNNLLRSPKLSFATKGLFLYLLSKPNGWKNSVQSISKDLKTYCFNSIERFKKLKVNCEFCNQLTTNRYIQHYQKNIMRILLSTFVKINLNHID